MSDKITQEAWAHLQAAKSALISGVWAAWLHEAETLWFVKPHSAVAA